MGRAGGAMDEELKSGLPEHEGVPAGAAARVTELAGSGIIPGRMPASRHSAAKANIAPIENRSTSFACSAAFVRGRPRKVTPNALTKHAAASAADRQAAQDTLHRGARIARSMTMQMPDGSFVINTSNSAGRIAEEMENFVRTAHPSSRVEVPSTYGPGQEGNREHSIYNRRR